MGRRVEELVIFSILTFLGVVGFVVGITGISLGYSDKVEAEGIDDGAFFERWWPLALQGTVSVVVVIAYIIGVLEKEMVTCLGFLVLSTAVLMSSIHSTLWSVQHVADKGEKQNAELAAAGFTLLALVNCAGIVILGLRLGSDKPTVRQWTGVKIAATVVIGLLLLAGWGLMLAGAVLQQVGCFDEDALKDCSYNLRFTWWIVAFEGAVLVTLLIAMIIGHVEKAGVCIAAFLTLVTSNLMDKADDALSDVLTFEPSSKELVASGVLILCIMNIVLLLAFALAGLMKANEEQVASQEQTAWVISTSVTMLPLLLGLAFALTGIIRLQTLHCEAECTNLYRASYWAIAFELVVAIGIAKLAYFKKESLPKVRGFILAFLVLASIETMREAGEILLAGGEDTNSTFATSQGIAATGFMVVSAMNFVLMLILGCEECSTDASAYEPAPV